MIPAIVAIIVGLAVGGLLVASSRRDAAMGRGAQADDLVARKESIYAQVRELDDTRDRLDPALYQSERARLLDEAAGVLRELDAPAPAPAPAPSTSPSGFLSRHPQLTGALWGGLVGGFGFAIYSAVSDQAAPRAEGQSVTGGQAMSAPAEDPALAALAAEVEAKPADLEAKNRYGHALINADRVREAWKLADAVTEIDPGNAEARTHQAVTLMEIGDFDMAGAVLDRVLAEHASFAEALGYRGAIYARAGDKENAVAMWTRAKLSEPSQAAVFDELIARVDSLAAPPTSPAAPGDGTSAAPGDGPGAVEFSGEIHAPPGTDGSTGVLFVSVRPAGVESGPPARASRLGAPTFPAPFSLSAANAPMGGSISGPVVITAKLDLDGNPSTQEPGNLVGRSAPVEVGATGLVIQLASP